MRISAYWIRNLFLVAAVLAQPALAAEFGEEVALDLYQIYHGLRCDPASLGELKRINIRRCNPDQSRLNEVEQIAENLVFDSIARRETKTLGCSINIATAIGKDQELRERAVESTCRKLRESGNPERPSYTEVQKKIWQLLDQLEQKNSATMCHECAAVSDPDRHARVSSERNALEKQLALLLKEASDVQTSDLLLSSPTVLDKVHALMKGGLLNGTWNPYSGTEICDYLKKNTAGLLDQHSTKLASNKITIEETARDHSWKNRNDLKVRLWASESRRHVLAINPENSAAKRSTLCRLEGRYGEGNDFKNAAQEVAILGFSIAIPIAGELAEMRLASIGARSAARYARFAPYLSQAAAVYSAGNQAWKACERPLEATASSEACAASPEQAKSLAYQKIETGDCRYAVAQAAALAALTGAPLALRTGSRLPLTAEKEAAVKQLANSLRLGNKGKHSVEVTNQGVILKIGNLHETQDTFMTAALDAIRKGAIDEINAGKIIGPKVLPLLKALSKAAPKERKMIIRGHLKPSDLAENVKTFFVKPGEKKIRIVTGEPVDPVYLFTEKQTRQFQQALDDLKIPEACKQHFRTNAISTDLSSFKECGALEFVLDTASPQGIIWRKSKGSFEGD